MCGLVGSINKNSGGVFAKDMDNLEMLLHLDQLRGDDSTGIYAVGHRNSDVNIVKVATIPSLLFKTEQYRSFRQWCISDASIMIGHNRKATKGKVSSDNAHPFNEGPITLVHNGTLFNHSSLSKKGDVDSHAVCHALAEEPDARKVLKEVDGAFAFIWYDQAKQRLFVIRNNERPLAMMETDRQILLASEPWMMLSANKRTTTPDKIIDVTDVEPGHLYTFTNIGKLESKEKVELWTPKVYQGGWKQEDYDKRRMNAMFACGWEGDCDDPDFEVMKQDHQRNIQQNPNLLGLPNPNTSSQTPSIYVPGTTVVLSPTRVTAATGGGWDVYGTCRAWGKGQVDFVGKLEEGEMTPAQRVDLYNGAVLADVASYYTTACGPSVRVNKMRFVPKKKDYSGIFVNEYWWAKAQEHATCRVCGGSMKEHLLAFSTVERKADNTVQCVCSNCIEKSLTGESKNEFVKNWLAAVEDAERISEEVKARTIPKIETQDSQTLH